MFSKFSSVFERLGQVKSGYVMSGQVRS